MTSHLFEKLQKQLSSFYAEMLPTEIRFRDAQGVIAHRALEEATVDELAFAIQTINEESSLIARRRHALEEIYASARRQGAFGAKRLADLIGGGAQ